MQEGTFSISALENAHKRLGDVLKIFVENENDDIVRDSVIQRFEFTYSIALKTLKKYFEGVAFVMEDVQQMTFNQVIRVANKLDLLHFELDKWTEFRQMRNLTSHTYDEEVARKVVAVIPDFCEEVGYLLKQLRSKING
ncbi:MAG: nucleotidyltransferase substrate binding protein [Brachyspira sp.]|nr:nucleotidyltransferase substrate binding protein [Brachyspira sp.]